MLREPNTIVLYVSNIAASSRFYEELLGSKPEETLSTFHRFKLASGMSLAIKTKESVIPPVTQENGNGELAFIVDDMNKVDKLHKEWQACKRNILMPPTELCYGYAFVAGDPDGNRLRFVALKKDQG